MYKYKDNKTSISDIPFSEERNDFGTERYVNGLIRFIEQSDAPITIALQGEWGSGKTSLMSRLVRALCNGPESQFAGIEINTWEYSMLASPEMTVYKIMAQLVNALTNKSSDSKKKVTKLLNGLYRGGREAFKLIPYVGVAMEALNVPNENPFTGNETESISLADLKAELEKAVKQTITEGNKRGVIVFVDDLDRLNPPVAVEILELLKNVFCIDNCIFVLAIDYEVVVKGLEPKFGKLTEKNEREFRSFFDKIIQVPFSLPVSSYRPMDFVLDSLVKIGYITRVERDDDRIKRPFSEIVEYSVGKNPRSIKRLINTLSLLSCISECGAEDKDDFIHSRAGRISNFAIVALQVCYPKIYKMLALMPNFLNWDSSICTRMNLHLKNEDGEEFGWEDVLDAVCSGDNYLSQRHNDIRDLLYLIQATIEESKNGNDSLEQNIRSMIDKSSVTGISEPVAESEVNQKRLIDTLHRLVSSMIRSRRPDISEIKRKNNTGNGGLFLSYPDGKRMEVIFRPRVTKDKIACEILLRTGAKSPEHLIGKSSEEIMSDPKVSEAMSAIDRTITPLLKDVYYFEGRTYPESGLGTYFKSFSDEMKLRMDKGWLDGNVANDVSYWINLKSEELFSDRNVIETITDAILAAYDFRKAAANF